MQSKKSSEVEIIASEKISKDLLGIFSNSFALANYEFTMKTSTKNDKEEEKKDDDFDERTKKITRKVEKFEITSAD